MSIYRRFLEGPVVEIVKTTLGEIGNQFPPARPLPPGCAPREDQPDLFLVIAQRRDFPYTGVLFERDIRREALPLTIRKHKNAVSRWIFRLYAIYQVFRESDPLLIQRHLAVSDGKILARNALFLRGQARTVKVGGGGQHSPGTLGIRIGSAGSGEFRKKGYADSFTPWHHPIQQIPVSSQHPSGHCSNA